MTRAKVYASVWDALADTPEQAANLRARAELMQQIAAIVKKNRWTQTEAAQRCGITQPRINDLLRGRVSRFSLVYSAGGKIREKSGQITVRPIAREAAPVNDLDQNGR
jgi:predicted XRE-type DNA-binding protein